MASPSNPSGRSAPITRRSALRMAAGAGMIGLAGCAGDDDGNGGGNGGDGNDIGNGNGGGNGGDSPEGTFTAGALFNVPQDLQYNEFNFTNYSWLFGGFAWDPLAVYDPQSSEFIPVLAEEWNIDGDNQLIELTIRDDYYWHNGDQVTAQDVYSHFALEQYMGWSSSNFVEMPEVTGDFSLEFPLKGEFNETMLNINFLRQNLTHAPYDVYEEFLQRFEDASSDEERDQVASDLTGHSVEEPVGTGPFKVVDATEQKLICEKHEDHPAAGDLNFNRFVWQHSRSAQDQWQGLRSGVYDGIAGLSAPKQVLAEFPDNVVEIRYDGNGGFALTPNHDREPFDDRRVRQAIQHLLDRETISINAGEATTRPTERITGLTNAMTEEWLSGAVGDFVGYGGGAERAAELLEEAGFSRSGDQWMTPDGQPWQVEMKGPSGDGTMVTAGQTIANTFRQFGVQIEFLTVEDGTFWGETFPNSDYDIALDGWGGDFNTPWHVYNGALTTSRPDYNYPGEVELPPVGDPDGETETVNLDELVDTLASSSGEDYQEATRTLAWLWNYDLPKIQVYETISQEFLTDDEWEFPDPDSEHMLQPPVSQLPKFGELRRKE